MDKALALAPLSSSDDAESANAYTNIHPPWCPPWGRGIFGGSLIAQSLCAAQNTVASSFYAHSMHCYFLRPGIASEKLIYYVNRLYDGKRFVTRTVHARQRSRDIFFATISFTRGEQPPISHCQGQMQELAHAVSMPAAIPPPPELTSITKASTVSLSKAAPTGEDRPYDCIRCIPTAPGPPEQRKFRHWIRARFSPSSPSSAPLGQQHHLAALAYMSDGYFIGTVARVQGARRFADTAYIERMVESLGGTMEEKACRREIFQDLASEEQADHRGSPGESVGQSGARVGMMATLHHAIFFHKWRGLDPDEWMLVEMDSPWAGDERGLVTQRIWSQAGELLATCIQEGVVRLASAVEEGGARL